MTATRLRNLLPTVAAVVAVAAITGPYVVEAKRDPARYGLALPATYNQPTTAPRPAATSRPPPTTTGGGSSTSATFPPSTIRHPGPTGTSGNQFPLSAPTVPAVPTVPRVTVPPTTLPTITTPRVTLPSIPRIICRPPPSQPHPDRDPTKPCLPDRKKP